MSCGFGVLTRTVFVLPDASGCGACSRYFPSKASADILDYCIDFSPWLSADCDSIISLGGVSVLTKQGDASDLVILDSGQINAGAIKFMLEYGHAGTLEKLSVTVSTALGRTITAIASIFINECTASAVNS